MALVLANRVQESATANTTVSFTLAGPISGFQSFAVIGDTNTTYYAAADASGNWEVGLGTYSSPATLTRTTVYASSNSGNAVTFSGTVNVFVTYPSGKSVNLDTAGNVSALGTVSSGTWQGTTVGVAYGGTGVTASSGANSVVLRDANQNVAVNRLNQSNTSTTAAGGTTALTAASSYIHTLVGTGGETYTMPDATTLTTGVAFVFNNMATGTLTIQNYAAGAVGTIPAGGAGAVFLTDNSTTGGIWDIHAYLPEGVTFGTNAFNLGTSVISGGTWQGGTIQPGYGGTGLTTFTGANNALYSTGATTLTAGTLPSAAGGTGLTTFTGANNALYSTDASTLTAGTLPVAAGGTGATTASGALTSLGAVAKAGDTMTGELTLAASTTANASLNIPSGVAPTSPVASDLWYDGTNIFFRVGANTRQIPFALTGGSGTSPQFTSLTVTNTFAAQATTSNIDIGHLQSTGTWTAGGTSGTGAITLGRSTLSQTTNIQAGATASGSTKTINFGTGGLSGSTTNIAIGSDVSGATTNVTANGTWTYANTISGSVSGSAASATTATNLAAGVAGAIPYQSGAGTTAFSAAGTTGQVLTSAGTGAPTWTTATDANTASAIVQRDASGNFSAGTITASLNGNASTATSATSATSATTATNLAAGTAGAVPYQSGAGTTGFSAAGTSGQVLTSTGTGAPTWTTATNANTASAIVQRDASGNFSAGTITATLSGSATTATTATNLAGGVAGALPYQSGAGTTLFSAAGTAGQILQSNGAAAPTWVTPAYAPLASPTFTGTVSVNGNTNLGNSATGQTYTTRISGYGVDDGGIYGSYGTMIINATSAFTSGARRYMITNALSGNTFAIIRSTNATTDPAIGSAGNLSSGTVDFAMSNTGNVGVGTASPFANLHVNGSTGILTRQSSLQDGIAIVGRAGGTSEYSVTLTPATLTANRTITLPNETGTLITTAASTTEFTSTATWTKPTGAKWVLVQLWGAGGGGGKGGVSGQGSNASGGGGGGGGSYATLAFPADSLASSYTVTIGAGGTGATSANGGNGGTTSFGTLLYAYGGGGGLGGFSASASTGGGGASLLNSANLNGGGQPTTISGSGTGGGGVDATSGGNAGNQNIYGGATGGGGSAGGSANVGGQAAFGGAGGGSGGGTKGSSFYAGGGGGGRQSLSGVNGGGTDGAAGSNGTTLIMGFGLGGGGGASSTGSVGGVGGTGGRASGGGGGGASTGTGGNGGTGGAGYATITTYF